MSLNPLTDAIRGLAAGAESPKQPPSQESLDKAKALLARIDRKDRPKEEHKHADAPEDDTPGATNNRPPNEAMSDAAERTLADTLHELETLFPKAHATASSERDNVRSLLPGSNPDTMVTRTASLLSRVRSLLRRGESR